MPKHELSKSTYIRGLQCEKSLFLNKHHRELRDELTEVQRRIFGRGISVGKLALDLFPGGKDATPENFWDFSRSLQDTYRWISSGERFIYEAAFMAHGVLVALDVLVKAKGAYYAYEVKSSKKISPTFIRDAALQYWVITNSGVKLEDFFIVFVNDKYVKDGEVDIRQYFKKESVLDKILPLQKTIDEQVKEMKKVLKLADMPEKKIGPHCNTPYSCDFKGYCWKDIPEKSVFDLTHHQGEPWELLEMGIKEIKDIPLDYSLSAKQKIQVMAEKSGEWHVEKEPLQNFLKELKYPIRYFDIESVMPAVPLYDGSKPYQPIVFQYSVHQKNDENSGVEELSFLADEKSNDPRIDFIEQLIGDLGDEGSVVVYYADYEKARLSELGNAFPQYLKQVKSIIKRMVDLYIPFKNNWVYAPEMIGSASLKRVLPALVPELSYSDLAIKEGADASAIFENMISNTPENREELRENLKAYCSLDTMALVKIHERLKTL